MLEALPTKKELRLWLGQSKVELGQFYFSMLPDQVSNPGPLTYESGALPIALRGPAVIYRINRIYVNLVYSVNAMQQIKYY